MQSNAAGHCSCHPDFANFEKRIESGEDSIALLIRELIQAPGKPDLDYLLMLRR
jgi:hypothetical protein